MRAAAQPEKLIAHLVQIAGLVELCRA